MILYIFITHQKNINNCYDRISNMTKDDFVVVQGGFIKDEYDENNKILKLNCNDSYVGLPEKVMKTFHFIINNKIFDKYTHFCKVDDDVQIVKKFEKITDDYSGNVCTNIKNPNRRWHIGKCNNFWDNIEYTGEYRPWCLGGYGYIVSRNSLNKICPNFNYLDHIYEDVYIASLLHNVGIFPKHINIKEYIVSSNHTWYNET